MDVTLDKNITSHPQIKGIGETTTDFLLTVNIGNIIAKNETRKFIISMEMDVNNITYHYNNINSVSDIDQDGNLTIGNVTVLGSVDPSTIVTRAKITYLVAS